VFEVPAIVGEECEIVLTGRDRDHEIEVGNAFPLGAQPASLPSEQLGSLFIGTNNGHVLQEFNQPALVPFGVV
jgi:hypothetical protein